MLDSLSYPRVYRFKTAIQAQVRDKLIGVKTSLKVRLLVARIRLLDAKSVALSADLVAAALMARVARMDAGADHLETLTQPQLPTTESNRWATTQPLIH